MEQKKRTVVTECVAYGHPDKIADQIADAIVASCVKEDPNTRAGVEVMVKDNLIVLGGELSTAAKVDRAEIARNVMDGIVFPSDHNLSRDKLRVVDFMGVQSHEISRGVDRSDGNIGAGDQGFVVGYANNETSLYLPWGVYLTRAIVNAITEPSTGLGPDAKSQVIVEYLEDGSIELKDILVSTMHTMPLETARKKVEEIVDEIVDSNTCGYDDERPMRLSKDYQLTVNPNGEWLTGGPVSDCGVTGRKLVVDQYGGYCNIGGGALSGKDFTKVDRSAAYMARYIAKNIVAAGLADEAKVTLSYKISVPEPSSVEIELNRNQEIIPQLIKWVKENILMSPLGIIRRFGHGEDYIARTAREGHFSRDYPWEAIDMRYRILNDFKPDF